MHKKSLFTTAFLLLMVVLLTVFLSPAGDSVQAFNQSNLIRVVEIREVDGQLYYRRVAPVYDIHP